MDDRLRKLERQWKATGDFNDGLLWFTEAMRSDANLLFRLFLGIVHVYKRPLHPNPPTPDDCIRWMRGEPLNAPAEPVREDEDGDPGPVQCPWCPHREHRNQPCYGTIEAPQTSETAGIPGQVVHACRCHGVRPCHNCPHPPHSSGCPVSGCRCGYRCMACRHQFHTGTCTYCACNVMMADEGAST